MKQAGDGFEQSGKKASLTHDNSDLNVTTHTSVKQSQGQRIKSFGKQDADQQHEQQFPTKSEVTHSLKRQSNGMT